MGLLDKITDKLSGNKDNTTEERLQHEGVDSSRQHGAFSGEGSHLQSNTDKIGTSHGVHGTTGVYGSNAPGQSTVGSGIGGTHTGSNVPGTHSTTTGGLGSTHSGSAVTGSHTGTHVPGTSGTTSGITGGTHPIVTGEQAHTGSHQTGGLNASGVGSTHTGSNIPGTHTGSGIGGTHSGSHIPGSHSTHTTPHTSTGVGSGITGGTAVGSNTGHHTGTGTLGSSHRAEAGDIGSRDYAPDASVGQGTHHNTPRHPVDPYSSKGQRAMADAAEGRSHHTATQGTDFVPGSHPAAQNPSAIPTAGGERVGSIPGGHDRYDDNRTQDNRSGMEKIKDKVVPSRTDRPDDPVTGQNYSQQIHSSHNTTGSHIPGTTGSHNTTSGSHIPSTTGSHATTTGSHGLTGQHGSAATPLAHDSSFSQRHTGDTTTGAGLAGTGVGAGLASSGHHDTHGHQQYAAGQHAAQDQYGSSNNSGIVDNRSGMEKIKDKVIPSRTDRPDDPITGQNYSQETHGSQQYTGTTASHIPGSTQHTGTTGSHIPGSTISNNTTASTIPGSTQHATTTGGHLPGSTQHAGQGSHFSSNNDHYGSSNTSGIVDNRSGMEKIKDKVIPSRTDRPDDLATGQNYGQGVSSSQQHTGTTGSHHPGSTHGNHTYGSGMNDGGVSGMTHGVGNVGLGGNSGAHPPTGGSTLNAGHLGGAYEAGYNDAVRHLRAEQNRQ